MAGACASARYLSFLSWFHYQVFLSDTTIISRHAKLNSFQLTHLLEHVVLKLVSLINVRLSLVESSEADIFRSSLSMALSPPPYSIYRWRILEDRRDGARDVRAFRARHLPCRIEYGEDESHLDGTKPPGVTPVDEKMYEEIREKKRAPRYCMAFRT